MIDIMSTETVSRRQDVKENNLRLKAQACPWEWDFHGNPMGNVPWDGMGQHELHFPWDPWDSSHVTAS